MKEIYLDYNATTPIDKTVQEHIMHSLNNTWANPSSSSSLGILAKRAIETARHEVALTINSDSSDIIFTSGGTEANNMAIYSAVKSAKDKGCSKPHIITSNVEHVATSNPLAELLKKFDISVTEVNVDERGMLAAEDVLSAIKNDTCFITLMLANNETGVIFPIEEISRALKGINNERMKLELPNILFHTDAAQAIGKINVDINDLSVDYLTIVGHKFHGPRIGALYVRNLCKNNIAFPMFHGGGQERGYRPGTENTAMIVGLGKAADLVNKHLAVYKSQMKETRDYLEFRLHEAWDDIVVNCCTAPRLPNTANISFRGISCSGAELLAQCSRTIASTTAACHVQSEPSKVLIASGVPKDLAVSAIRFSTGRESTKDDIDVVIHDIKNAIQKLVINGKIQKNPRMSV